MASREKFDIIIIGGGPSGLMAAAAAGKGGAGTLLLDKGSKLGRKLGISGGGRCNVTNNKEPLELIRYIPGNGKFLHSALSEFGSREIIAFFESLGIRLKEEDRGRMFPVSDKAKTVVDALVGTVRDSGVTIRINEKVAGLMHEDGRIRGVRLTDGRELLARAVIVATGGMSVPHTGSTGDAYPWADAAGHTVTELYPTEVPLTSAEPFIRSRRLQGLSLRGIVLSVWNTKGKVLTEQEGDMIFTHFGLSGPAALRCSQFVVKERKKNGGADVRLTVDLFPDRSADGLYGELLALAENEPRKAFKNVLTELMQDRMVEFSLELAGLNPLVTYDNLNRATLQEYARLLKQLPVRVNGTLSIEEAFVTGGGVHLKEINPRTMESKLIQGLYFCGEVLDLHGYTGGYNITAAFTTGRHAGASAALQVKQELASAD
ncbi:hypothetical protein SAMN05444162_1265 [Paenibacillaceae bacterium GAS479]|nr:hypothetical protein SAMN05444162_1265 [Paenibacillaceae bacterium GAS479]